MGCWPPVSGITTLEYNFVQKLCPYNVLYIILIWLYIHCRGEMNIKNLVFEYLAIFMDYKPFTNHSQHRHQYQ